MRNRFEFMTNVAISQYIPRDSFIHHRDPRARVILYFLLFIGVVFTPNFFGIGTGLLIASLFYFLAKVPLKPAWLSFRRTAPFLLALALLQIALGKKVDSDVIFTTLFGIIITKRAIISAGMLLGRFFLLIILLNGFAMTISTSQISAALFYLLKPLEVIRFPVNDLTMVVQIAMRFLPMLAQSAEKIVKAQASRGGDWDQSGFNPVRQAKRVLPLIVPLIVNSLKQAETMAIAMESRGFNAAEKRSSFYELVFTWMDGLCVLVAISLCTFLILFV